MSQEKSDSSGSSNPAHRIKEARERRGLTQAALAAQLGVARPMIAQWETGARHPWISTLKRLGEALGVSYEWLAFGQEEAHPSEDPRLDPTLFAAVQAVVTEAFEERDLEVGELFFFQVIAAVYAVAWRLRMNGANPASPSMQATLRESVLHVLSA